ncbi:hypothetical protein EEDFHM_02983 [Methylorubrum populi]|uniref:Uncharacterized protein n=1 Tax=Methylorubrum populi TaxID=223967 RepID=A0A921E2R7_9HYPH|nr:hypothetical protein [Methylorubrum populi]
MINSAFLIPPGFGPLANPILFGVSDALAQLFPLQASGGSCPEAPAARSEESASASTGHRPSDADRTA